MDITIGRWKNCTTEPPEEDGKYLVCRVVRGEIRMCFELGYTREWGWNTFQTEHSYPMDFSDKNDYYWTKMSVEGVTE